MAGLEDVASWVEVHESVLDIATGQFLDAWREVIGAAGQRGFAMTKSNLLEQIRDFLAVEEQGQAGWETKIAEWALSVGRDEAEITAWHESTRLWAAINRLGGLASVRTALVMKDSEEAAKALKEANRVLDRPRATIVPTPEPFDPVQWLDDLVTGAAGGGPVPPTPPIGPFPTWPPTVEYQGIFPPPPPRSMDTVPIGEGLNRV